VGLQLTLFGEPETMTRWDRTSVAGSAGATIVAELDAPWGPPMYTVEDLEKNRWTLAQARLTM
jgi:hypothetical protein